MNPAGSEETRRHPGGRKTSSARKEGRAPGTGGSRPEAASPAPASFAEAGGCSGRRGGAGRPGPRGGRGGPAAGVGGGGSFCVSELERECAEPPPLPPARRPPPTPHPGRGAHTGFFASFRSSQCSYLLMRSNSRRPSGNQPEGARWG